MSENEMRDRRLNLLIDATEKLLISLERDAMQAAIGIGLKIMTPKQMITRLPILLAQLKSGNNSNKS